MAIQAGAKSAPRSAPKSPDGEQTWTRSHSGKSRGFRVGRLGWGLAACVGPRGLVAPGGGTGRLRSRRR